MQSSQRTATPIARAINSLVFGSSAPCVSAACASEEKAFITSGAPPRRFLSSALKLLVQLGQFVVCVIIFSNRIASSGSFAASREGATGLDAQALEDDRCGAEASEGGLYQVRAGEGAEPQPVRAEEIGEREAEQDHKACETHYRLIECHEGVLVFRLADPAGASHAGAQ